MYVHLPLQGSAAVSTNFQKTPLLLADMLMTAGHTPTVYKNVSLPPSSAPVATFDPLKERRKDFDLDGVNRRVHREGWGVGGLPLGRGGEGRAEGRGGQCGGCLATFLACCSKATTELELHHHMLLLPCLLQYAGIFGWRCSLRVGALIPTTSTRMPSRPHVGLSC